MVVDPDRELDVVIVGAGFAGLYMLHRCRQQGLAAVVVEAGDDVGGTWYWNRYPGARCDIESLEYSYGFDEGLQQEWEWTERYAAQPEILRYLQHVADRFDLRPGITFGTRVTAAVFDDDARTWRVQLDRGADLVARYLVMATGCLSSANVADVEGAGTFEGRTLHTGRWPAEGVDLAGRRVGVIGTGSSAVQAIPVIAEEATHLCVFQRTPAYVVPAWNRPLDPAEQAAVKAGYAALRAANRAMFAAFGARVERRHEGSALAVDEAERQAELERRWAHGGLTFLAAFNDLLLGRAANDVAREFVIGKLREIVQDPEVARRLTPDHVIGCKRLCVDSGYWAAFNRPDVTLVDLRETPIERITPAGVRTTEQDHPLDVIVFATGFDAMTGALSRIDIRGTGGQRLADAWAAGPRTYLGLMTHGFPNLFLVTGPGSPSVLANMVEAIQHHVEWIDGCLADLRARGLTCIEPGLDAQDRWVDHVNAVAASTLFQTCRSWYLGANVPGKTRVFMPLPGFPPYVETCTQVVAEGYRGFTRR